MPHPFGQACHTATLLWILRRPKQTPRPAGFPQRPAQCDQQKTIAVFRPQPLGQEDGPGIYPHWRLGCFSVFLQPDPCPRPTLLPFHSMGLSLAKPWRGYDPCCSPKIQGIRMLGRKGVKTVDPSAVISGASNYGCTRYPDCCPLPLPPTQSAINSRELRLGAFHQSQSGVSGSLPDHRWDCFLPVG